MKNFVTCILVIVLLGVCEWTQVQSVVAASSIDIWTAAEQGNIEAIQQHVSAGTDLNAKAPKRGDTPLIVAARLGQTEAAGLLIENRANPNARNNDGNTALHIAAWYCRTEIVKLLLNNGAEVNATSEVEVTWPPKEEDGSDAVSMGTFLLLLIITFILLVGGIQLASGRRRRLQREASMRAVATTAPPYATEKPADGRPLVDISEKPPEDETAKEWEEEGGG